jgi:hypothetical protein
MFWQQQLATATGNVNYVVVCRCMQPLLFSQHVGVVKVIALSRSLACCSSTDVSIHNPMPITNLDQVKINMFLVLCYVMF